MSAIVGTVFFANEDFNPIQNTELTVQGGKIRSNFYILAIIFWYNFTAQIFFFLNEKRCDTELRILHSCLVLQETCSGHGVASKMDVLVVHYSGACFSNFFSMKLMTFQSKPRYCSQLITLDFLVSLGTSWLRFHCFEAWSYKWSMECFDKPRVEFRSSSLSSSLKTSSTAFSASAWLTPFLDSAWHKTCS